MLLRRAAVALLLLAVAGSAIADYHPGGPPPNHEPSVSITSPASGATLDGPVTISGTASDFDGGSDIERVEVRIRNATAAIRDWTFASGTTSWSTTWDAGAAPDGAYTIEARAWDGTVYGPTASRPVTVARPAPNTAPTVVITAPPHGGSVNGTVTVAGSASDPDAGDAVERVEVLVRQGTTIVQGGRNATGTTDWAFLWDTDPLPEGAYTLEARAFDGEAYSERDEVSATVERAPAPPGNAAPSIFITAPQDQEVLQGGLVVRGTASDADGPLDVESVEVAVDLYPPPGEPARDATAFLPWTRANGTTQWSLDLSERPHPNGTYVVYAKVVDLAGSVAHDSVRAYVGSGPEDLPDGPQGNGSGITIIAPADGATVLPGPLAVRGTIWGHPAGALFLGVRLDDGPWVHPRTEGSVDPGRFGWDYWNGTLDLANATAGEHVVEARAQGEDGKNDSATIRVLVHDLTPDAPAEIRIVEPVSGAVAAGTVTLRGTVIDPDGDPVDRVEARPGSGAWLPADGVAAWSFGLDTRGFPDGPLAIAVRGVQGEAVGPPAVVVLVLDNVNEPPTLLLRSPAPGEVVAGRTTVDADVADPDPRPASLTVELRVGEGPWSVVELPHELGLAGLPPGPLVLTLRAGDGEAWSSETSVEVLVAPRGEEEGPATPVPGTAAALVALALAGRRQLYR